MQRIPQQPRPHWQRTVEQQGLTFHTPDDGAGPQPYWDETAAYSFTAAEIDTLEAAGNELQTMCLTAAQHVIDHRLYAQLEIPDEAVPLIEWAWEAEPPALYGRFDLLWNGLGSPKLLEYNADTPTSLLEAAVIQWYWLQDTHADADQFNSLHEKLIAKWKDLRGYISEPVYFASADTAEDRLTTAYLRDTAEQAGYQTRQLLMEQIGWNTPRNCFVDTDPQETEIRSIFKLYPWETMLEEEFAPRALSTYRGMQWIEPIWKMLLSNKGILPVLWQLYPGHPLLLESQFAAPGTPPRRGTVRKPMHSREGSNIVLTRFDGSTVTTDGPYTDRLLIDQQLGPDTRFADAAGHPVYPVLGLWMVDQECCGLGIREDTTPITGNFSRFVPHLFR